MKKRIATLSCCAAVVMASWLWTGMKVAATTAAVVGASSMVVGCGGSTKRSEIRQETRTEKRVEDRYDRRRGKDD